ncbi:MAG: lysylphosphatidylglycerol synthase transmembrane domain-containing protein, partial [Thermomicrobiales bacterium]
LWNYAWRFVKWRRYLRALDVPSSGLLLDLLIYLSGYSMSVTPGKVGELIRAVYIKRLTGVPVNRVSAAVVSERITDALAMLILALVGLLEFNYGRPFVALAVIGFAVGVYLLQRPALLHRLLDRAVRFPALQSAVLHGRAFLDATGVLFTTRLLLQAIGLGLISWTGECLAFFFVLYGLGMSATWALFLCATFILAISSLIGGVSLLPGGLGVTDATVAGMLVLLVDDPSMTRAVAAAATLIIRFATLWFAVLLGAISLAIVQRMLKNQEESQPALP